MRERIRALQEVGRAGEGVDDLERGSRLLVIDTCGSGASIVLAEGARVVERRAMLARSASELLVGEMRSAMGGAGWGLRELAAIAVVRGPGSFTGVRIGLSAAKGLAEGTGKPLIGLSRLDVLAAGIGDATEGVAVLDAGRGDCFWGRYSAGVTVEQGFARKGEIAARAAGGVVVCEEADAGSYEGCRVAAVPALTAAEALLPALRRVRAELYDDPMLLDALYLRRTEQELLERQAEHRSVREAVRAGVGRAG